MSKLAYHASQQDKLRKKPIRNIDKILFRAIIKYGGDSMKIIDECNHSEFSALDSKSLNVPFYYQGNSLWANDIMQTCGKTIGSEGCTITCLAMIQKYFTSTGDPSTVNKALGNGACPLASYSASATTCGLSIVSSQRTDDGTFITQSDVTKFIVENIKLGYPVLIGMAKKSSSGSTHFVVAKEYQQATQASSYVIKVNDLGTSKGDGVLLSSFESTYGVNRLYSYKKA